MVLDVERTLILRPQLPVGYLVDRRGSLVELVKQAVAVVHVVIQSLHHLLQATRRLDSLTGHAESRS